MFGLKNRYKSEYGIQDSDKLLHLSASKIVLEFHKLKVSSNTTQAFHKLRSGTVGIQRNTHLSRAETENQVVQFNSTLETVI